MENNRLYKMWQSVVRRASCSLFLSFSTAPSFSLPFTVAIVRAQLFVVPAFIQGKTWDKRNGAHTHTHTRGNIMKDNKCTFTACDNPWWKIKTWISITGARCKANNGGRLERESHMISWSEQSQRIKFLFGANGANMIINRYPVMEYAKMPHNSWMEVPRDTTGV